MVPYLAFSIHGIDYSITNIEGKISRIWLANEEGIFFLIQRKNFSTWLAETLDAENIVSLLWNYDI